VLTAVVLGGCATPALTPGSTLNLAAPCLPSGISEEFFFWPVVAFRQVQLRSEDGDAAEAVWVVHSRGDRAVAVVWAGEHLIAVDPSPESDDPDWIDSALVTSDEEGFLLRANPGRPCLWQRNVAGTRV